MRTPVTTWPTLRASQAAIAELGIDESQVIFKYNIPEDETCYDNAVDLAEQGCQIVFSDSYGHQTLHDAGRR